MSLKPRPGNNEMLLSLGTYELVYLPPYDGHHLVLNQTSIFAADGLYIVETRHTYEARLEVRPI